MTINHTYIISSDILYLLVLKEVYVTLNIYWLQWRVQEFVRGGGGNWVFLFAFQLFRGGSAQKIAEKMLFPAKKGANYNSLTFALMTFFFCFSISRSLEGGHAGPLPPPLDTRLGCECQRFELVVQYYRWCDVYYVLPPFTLTPFSVSSSPFPLLLSPFSFSPSPFPLSLSALSYPPFPSTYLLSLLFPFSLYLSPFRFLFPSLPFSLYPMMPIPTSLRTPPWQTPH